MMRCDILSSKDTWDQLNWSVCVFILVHNQIHKKIHDFLMYFFQMPVLEKGVYEQTNTQGDSG